MATEIKKSIGLEFEDFSTLCSLSYTNRELSALLYCCSQKRNEVIFALRDPKAFLKNLGHILNVVYDMLDSIKQLAISYKIELHNIPTVELMNMDDANIYVFHNFSCEQLSAINQCYYLSKGADIRILNPNLTIPHSINVLTKMQQDITVTIVRFEEYIRRFPDANLRSEYIQQNFINSDYD